MGKCIYAYFFKPLDLRKDQYQGYKHCIHKVYLHFFLLNESFLNKRIISVGT